MLQLCLLLQDAEMFMWYLAYLKQKCIIKWLFDTKRCKYFLKCVCVNIKLVWLWPGKRIFKWIFDDKEYWKSRSFLIKNVGSWNFTRKYKNTFNLKSVSVSYHPFISVRVNRSFQGGWYGNVLTDQAIGNPSGCPLPRTFIWSHKNSTFSPLKCFHKQTAWQLTFDNKKG